ncbi:hypothetical protein L596_016172 [Steinernema carpocapsae]|uniref:Uncharacterized protein n=1 Tax=Steinernema carpocapsae TaxID=34508 RepID=A0A4U5NHB3_STECR|nr:hypothetical protein L596_016172 [Steinernema carpocapsae]
MSRTPVYVSFSSFKCWYPPLRPLAQFHQSREVVCNMSIRNTTDNSSVDNPAASSVPMTPSTIVATSVSMNPTSWNTTETAAGLTAVATSTAAFIPGTPFTWYGLMIVIIVAILIMAFFLFSCYVDCRNRRTTMPASAKDDKSNSLREQANSVRRVELQNLLEASANRHRLREKEAQKAKTVAMRKAKRREQRQRMINAQKDVSEHSTQTQSHRSTEEEIQWRKSETTTPASVSTPPNIIHKVINERETDKPKWAKSNAEKSETEKSKSEGS